MISAQRMAETFPPAVVAHLSAMRPEVMASVPAECEGSTLDAGRVADHILGELADQLGRAKVGKAYDEAAIRDHAESYSWQAGLLQTLAARQRYAQAVGIGAPEGYGVTEAGAMARLADPVWWRRQLRRVWTRTAEEGIRKLGIVRAGRQMYASDAAVAHRTARVRRTREWMDSRVMVSEEGEQLEMLALHEKSIAAPAIRRTELMVRSRGFEEWAGDHGHECDFWTLTAPSAFHPQLSAGGRNPTYAGATARQAQQWLCSQWAKVRAMLKRKTIRVYGVRVAEPHHDGTPHWHLTMFGLAHELDLARVIVRAAWLSEYADEAGAQEYRCKVERIDKARGSATAYIAKYIAKNIDGHGAIGDEADGEGGQVSDNCKRVAAWANAHGIRQFQQFGGPQVGKWRELRRLRNEVEPEIIEDARAAADKNRWCEFMGLASEIQLVRETRRDGLIVRPACSLNRYGEERPAVVLALRDWHGDVVTRPHRWRIERKAGPDRGLDAHARSESERYQCSSAMPVRSFSESSPGSRLFSDLGPVAITVREDRADPSAGVDWSWIATVPFRESAREGPSNVH